MNIRFCTILKEMTDMLLLCIVGAALSIPTQISLTYGSSPEEMVISWAETVNSTDSVVQYGESIDELTRYVQPSVTNYQYLTYTSPFLYTAVVTDLLVGNKVYYYKIGSEKEGYSDVYNFKSHPGLLVEGVTFHILGDVGQTTDNSVNTMKQIVDDEVRAEISGGVLMMGDLSYADGDFLKYYIFCIFQAQ